MNGNIIFIILFNVILVILFKHKKYVYPLMFILLVSLLLRLIYKKREEYMEGYSNYDVYSYWLDEKNEMNNDDINVDLFDKIDRVINLLIEKETTEKDLIYGDKQCKGSFKVVDRGEESCGFNKYDEYKYIISEPGNNCEYLPGQVIYYKKPLCQIGEKCDYNQDCFRGKCINNKCEVNFDCNSSQLDNCDTEKKCEILNKEFGGDKYVFNKGKCVNNTCKRETFYDCQDKESCENLGYGYKWEPDKKIKCQKLAREVEKCNQYECPSGYSVSIENKDYKCKNLVPPSEINEYNTEILTFDEDGTAYIDECSSKVCCEPNYKCGQYYFPKDSNVKLKDECKGCDKKKCDDKCYSDTLSDNEKPYKLYRKGKLLKNIYYPYKDVKIDGKTYYDNNKCNSPISCSEEECTIQNICTCKNGIGEKGDKCVTNGSSICASCNDGFSKNGNGQCEFNECGDGSHRVNNTCQQNKCTCKNEKGEIVGKGATGEACTSNGSNICSSCNDGYLLVDNKCVVDDTCYIETDEIQNVFLSNLKEQNFELTENMDDLYYKIDNKEDCSKLDSNMCNKTWYSGMLPKEKGETKYMGRCAMVKSQIDAGDLSGTIKYTESKCEPITSILKYKNDKEWTFNDIDARIAGGRGKLSDQGKSSNLWNHNSNCPKLTKMCDIEFNKLCSPEIRGNEECKVCATKHQTDLKNAGCDNKKILSMCEDECDDEFNKLCSPENRGDEGCTECIMKNRQTLQEMGCYNENILNKCDTIDCDNGYSINDVNTINVYSSKCSQCKKGYYKGEDDEKCIPCGNSLSTLNIGSVSKESCIPTCVNSSNRRKLGKKKKGIMIIHQDYENTSNCEEIGNIENGCENMYVINNDNSGNICKSFSSLRRGCDTGPKCVPS